MSEAKRIKTALVSVYHKEGLDEIITKLHEEGVQFLSTGGTRQFIESLGYPCQAVEDLTSYPSILGGRVKTLHPKVFGGILCRRELEQDIQQIEKYEIPEIDLVIVDLYPFEATVASGAEEQAIIEKIDIGGISLIRAAAKNFNDVVIIASQAQYKPFYDMLMEHGAVTSREERRWFAKEAFAVSSHYDSAIFNYFDGGEGSAFRQAVEGGKQLRYGENPHQAAKFYAAAESVPYSLATAKQLNGKEMSYNNIQDANAALNIVREFAEPFCVGLKHMNPCGAAIGKDVKEAWEKAYEADKVSIFGGIVAVNRELTKEVAELMKPVFLEIIMAPSFSDEALEILCAKKNLRLLQVDMSTNELNQMQYVTVNGGLLVQKLDTETKEVVADMCVTERTPSADELTDLNFGWRIVKHVKSNAIVVVKDGHTVGVGAGQMNRVGSAEIALKQAQAAGFTEGLVLASDGFFPFDDTVTLAKEYGVTALVQPGGSVRDEDSVKRADEFGMTMLMTGMRHFKH